MDVNVLNVLLGISYALLTLEVVMSTKTTFTEPAVISGYYVFQPTTTLLTYDIPFTSNTCLASPPACVIAQVHADSTYPRTYDIEIITIYNWGFDATIRRVTATRGEKGATAKLTWQAHLQMNTLPKTCSELAMRQHDSGYYKLYPTPTCAGRIEYCDFSSTANGMFVVVPIKLRLPFHDLLDHSVTIIGEPITTSRVEKGWLDIRFDVNINEQITAFQFHIRMDQHLIVRNSFMKHSWGIEERSLNQPFPFAYNRRFKLKFLVDMDGYHVTMNGRYLLAYKHRYRPISNVNYFRVELNMNLYQIWFD